MISKKELAIKLSKLKHLDVRDIKLEQYSIESELAAELLWWIYLRGDVNGKVVADFGCGNGILGYGCLLLGAKKVYFVDIDEKAVSLAKENVGLGEFLNIDVKDFDKKVDVVIMNPPFGVQKRKADKDFLLKGFEVSAKIYSIHKIESEDFVEKVALENGFSLKGVNLFDFEIRKQMKFHKKKVHKVRVGLFALEKKNI